MSVIFTTTELELNRVVGEEYYTITQIGTGIVLGKIPHLAWRTPAANDAIATACTTSLQNTRDFPPTPYASTTPIT